MQYSLCLEEQVGSHKTIGWQKFTSKILKSLILDASPKVFMLWGNDAHNIYLEAKRNILWSD